MDSTQSAKDIEIVLLIYLGLGKHIELCQKNDAILLEAKG
jgi:hypothetical protein